MNYFIRDRLIALGFPEEVAMKHLHFVEMWETTTDEPAFLVIQGNHSYLTSTATPSLEGETPCLVFEIGKEKQ